MSLFLSLSIISQALSSSVSILLCYAPSLELLDYPMGDRAGSERG